MNIGASLINHFQIFNQMFRNWGSVGSSFKPTNNVHHCVSLVHGKNR